jgi:hypothetical protein
VKTFRTTIDIHAPVSRVWEVTGFEAEGLKARSEQPDFHHGDAEA